MDPHLRRGLSEYGYLRERLIAEFPDTDAITLRDTLEGLSSLPELLAAVLRSYLEDIALVAALDIRIDDMQERLCRIEQRADKKRELVTSAMLQAEFKRLTEPDFTASLRAVPPSLRIVDEKQIPTDFWTPQPPKLDRQGLTHALKAGRAVAGAVLSKGQITLSVRTK